MVRLHVLGLAWMLCGFITFCEPAVGAPCDSGEQNQRKTEVEPTCNGKSYNPEHATCCGGQNKTAVTEGLSERMSQCCGLQAYNPLNEICCNSVVHAKPSHNATCCDSEPFDNNTQLCCGKPGNKTLLTKLSSDHECCINTQYNTKIELCCPDLIPRVQLKIPGSDSCGKNLSHAHSVRSYHQPSDTNETKVCKSADLTEIYSKKKGFECCGLHYVNKSLWSCSKGKLIPAVEHRENPLPKVLIGILESMSLNNSTHYLVRFTGVFRVNGRKPNASRPPKKLLEAKSLNLVLGNVYFFSESEVLIELSHNSTIKLLYSIFSKCS
ncbi:galaxin [Kryptolebias marmoratus]|uniref:galaxin n=1 Tax=Kryptolebias marmoratus TaxID=37003 RepID=UPI0018ACFD60|nr:galaxin [Kryptolebias marmoratus]